VPKAAHVLKANDESAQDEEDVDTEVSGAANGIKGSRAEEGSDLGCQMKQHNPNCSHYPDSCE
jgi:hypothetical protein